MCERRLLLVISSATNRSILSAYLQSWGCCHNTAASGEEALAWLHEAVADDQPYDLAILDQRMPDLSGELLGRAIRRDPALAHTLLVLLTAVTWQPGSTSVGEDFAASLSKPVRPSQLFDCLLEVLGEDQDRTKDQPRTQVHDPSPADPVLTGARILVAEDNPVNQKLALLLLEGMGCNADAVANGEEALAALCQIPYDLVVMDCQMPKMDGYQATSEIRLREGDERHTPIIAMTANALAGDREKCLAAGMDDYVSKPVQPQELAAAIARWLPPIATIGDHKQLGSRKEKS